jgi:hypothetical protein
MGDSLQQLVKDAAAMLPPHSTQMWVDATEKRDVELRARQIAQLVTGEQVIERPANSWHTTHVPNELSDWLLAIHPTIHVVDVFLFPCPRGIPRITHAGSDTRARRNYCIQGREAVGHLSHDHAYILLVNSGFNGESRDTYCVWPEFQQPNVYCVFW